MLNAVDQMLVAWGEWSRRSQDRNAGWSKVSPMFRMRSMSSSWGAVVLADTDAMEIERAMIRLKEERPELHQLAMDWYVRHLTVSELARKFKCHRSTVYQRLAAIHRNVYLYLESGGYGRLSRIVC